MNEKRYGIDAVKLLITLIGGFLALAIGYFVIGYTRRQDDEEGFFQCNIAYGNFYWNQWIQDLPDHPYNFYTFNANDTNDVLEKNQFSKINDVLEIKHNPMSDPHMWITISE